MKIDDREWQDPYGDRFMNDLAYGQGDARYSGGLWWLIPVVLVLYAVGAWYGLYD